ncbi:cyanophycinase [Pararcticibacter amylolyticus]|uniref:Cyanophycinase n=2 Tax=Pararcticibacter amylolyticus TaxID=2173175 RepID=A0A2U2PEL2_9SPHI|nr:cyanophycinase [Pararcticibacter amylolyticus]
MHTVKQGPMKEEPINECPVPKGILMIIGGHENKGENPEKDHNRKKEDRLSVLKVFVSLINSQDPVIEIVTSASSEGDVLFGEYLRAFHDLGVKRVGHIHHDDREKVLHEAASCIDRIKQTDAVFFSGGDQLKLTFLYGGTELLLCLKQRYIREQLVIGGTSAGAMAMSTPMIYAGNKDVQQIAGEVKITTGLEFLKDVCIDTHFVDRGRFVRMAQVVATNPTCIGIGIEEDTAIIIRNGIEAEVCGTGILITIDGRHIRSSNITEFGDNPKVTIRDLHVDVLSEGNSFIIPQTNPPHI